MNELSGYSGRCFCGAVQFTLSGEPQVMAYCHCSSCRHWSAGPVSAFTLWTPDAIHITRGSENISAFDKNPGTDNNTVLSNRKWCRICGGHVYTEHPTMDMIDIPAVVLDDFTFEPAFHVHYQETVHRMKDGLPKFKDLPKEAAGSGDQLPD